MMPPPAVQRSFTIIELLIVMSIIFVLAGLVLAASGYVQKKGYRSRAEAEIAAMSAALESYKADNGIYPGFSAGSGSGHALYQAFTGDGDDAIGGTNVSQGTPPSGAKSYITLRANMTTPPSPSSSTRVTDPWKFDYGYLSPGINNPTFDLWSTGPPDSNGGQNADRLQWIKN
ncbi:MAG: type II secretion system GspH family protein [Verrucomicrobiota bacterium]|nr:type II secretion system GspH family protein [Verrucomicrobiota bacterium]